MAPSSQDRLKGLYKLDLGTRRDRVGEVYPLDLPLAGLPEAVGDQMVENYLCNYDLPLGLATNFTVNGQAYSLPLALEEPSVIAAASNGARMAGDIQAFCPERRVIGQVAFHQVGEEGLTIIEGHKLAIMDQANQYCQSMVRRGGGVKEVWGEIKADFLLVYLSFDPCDAMGANALNTVLEGIKPYLAELLQVDPLVGILSNYQPQVTTTARAQVPVHRLSKEPGQGLLVAQRIQALSQLAQVDPYRAVTHNKGIMNGISGLALATGNDWRALEAGVHAYACESGSYKGLSQWHLSADQAYLEGVIEVPLALATVGGTLSNHPVAQWSLDLMGRPSARQLSQLAASLGLAQNLAALRALVAEGIQAGHMALQAKSLAMQVGANPQEADQVAQLLRASQDYSRAKAQEILAALRNESEK